MSRVAPPSQRAAPGFFAREDARIEDAVHGRDRELRAIERFLDDLDDGPALLEIHGDAGLGKTTLGRAAVRRATERGARVLTCVGAVAEARLSYVALADLFADVDPGIFAALSRRRRDALDAALLRAGASTEEADPSCVAAGALEVLESLSEEQPVVVAIDDLQWVDGSSARVLEYCARRLTGSVGLMVTRRTGLEGGPVPQLADRRAVRVFQLEPLDPEALTSVVRTRARYTPSPRSLARVVEAAGGNPLYALELLRELPRGAPPTGPLALPSTLLEMVTSHLAGLGPDVDELLLTVAAVANPTLDLLTRTIGDDAPALVERAVAQGVLTRSGRRVRFTHPLLAEGTLARAPATRRRAMHRRLSGVVTDVEDRARHLALAELPDEALPALDEAARRTRARGAPAAAAELLELALGLGGDNSLKVRAAEHHLDAGDVRRAARLLEAATAELAEGEERARALVLLAEIRTRDDSFLEARTLLEQARAETVPDSPLEVVCGLQLTFVLYSLGLRPEAAATGHQALALAERLGAPDLVAQALGAVAAADFALGRGIDERSLERSLALEDPAFRTSIVIRPSLMVSFVLGFAGRLDEAVELLERLRRECEERGEDHDLAWLCSRLVWFECWRGNLDAAERAVTEAEERLLALDTAVGRMLALTARAQVEAYAGRADSARAVAEQALALAEETDWQGAVAWQHMTLGFLELSMGSADAAAERLTPFVAAAIACGLPEPAADGALVYGDAAEALILVGRVALAEPLVALLERRGEELDRTWAIAVGARCRALILAAAGDVEGAKRSLRRALLAHDRLPMPVERGRTLLTLGRVQRRMGERRAAKGTLEEALGIFETVRSPLWAERARNEVAALGLRAGPRNSLTPSEERVARMAGSGMTNGQIASALQISPKTVEAHLGRVYRKLGIRSRAELGARMADA
jgi:DNA-binding CsgD family transcriptional regulator